LGHSHDRYVVNRDTARRRSIFVAEETVAADAVFGGDPAGLVDRADPPVACNFERENAKFSMAEPDEMLRGQLRTGRDGRR